MKLKDIKKKSLRNSEIQISKDPKFSNLRNLYPSFS